MKLRSPNRITILFGCLFLLPTIVCAQGTLGDYERAQSLRSKFQGLAINVAERANWIEKTNRFWYRKSVKGGHEFVLFDAESLTKKPAFDHEKLAASLSAATAAKYTALDLPFTTLTYVDTEQAIEFVVANNPPAIPAPTDNRWKCTLGTYICTRVNPADRRATVIPLSPQNRPSDQPKASPDGMWEAFVKNFNVYVRPKGSKEDFALSFDGSENNYYALNSINWSPDSRAIAAYRVRPGYHRKIQYIESSPADQLQPKYSTIEYAKPGDTLDIEQPVLFLIAAKQQIDVANTLFSNAYDISNPVWRKDSRAFTFEYNQRGHQVYRIIEVDATTGKARALLSEESKTFFCYSGKKYRYDVQDGKEIVWMSERDGWNHLYLFDPETGKVKHQAACIPVKILTSITTIESILTELDSLP